MQPFLKISEIFGFLRKITILMSNHLIDFLKVDSDWLGDFFDLISLVVSLVNLNSIYSVVADLNKVL